MAYLATIQLLIDSESESAATIYAQELLALHPSSNVVDSQVVNTSEVNEAIRESIANGTYVMGACFGNYLVVRNHPRPEHSAFWSTQYGWTSYDLATRFSADAIDIPLLLRLMALRFIWIAAPKPCMSLSARLNSHAAKNKNPDLTVASRTIA